MYQIVDPHLVGDAESNGLRISLEEDVKIDALMGILGEEQQGTCMSL